MSTESFKLYGPDGKLREYVPKKEKKQDVTVYQHCNMVTEVKHDKGNLLLVMDGSKRNTDRQAPLKTHILRFDDYPRFVKNFLDVIKAMSASGEPNVSYFAEVLMDIQRKFKEAVRYRELHNMDVMAPVVGEEAKTSVAVPRSFEPSASEGTPSK